MIRLNKKITLVFLKTFLLKHLKNRTINYTRFYPFFFINKLKRNENKPTLTMAWLISALQEHFLKTKAPLTTSHWYTGQGPRHGSPARIRVANKSDAGIYLHAERSFLDECACAYPDIMPVAGRTDISPVSSSSFFRLSFSGLQGYTRTTAPAAVKDASKAIHAGRPFAPASSSSRVRVNVYIRIGYGKNAWPRKYIEPATFEPAFPNDPRSTRAVAAVKDGHISGWRGVKIAETWMSRATRLALLRDVRSFKYWLSTFYWVDDDVSKWKLLRRTYIFFIL